MLTFFTSNGLKLVFDADILKRININLLTDLLLKISFMKTRIFFFYYLQSGAQAQWSKDTYYIYFQVYCKNDSAVKLLNCQNQRLSKNYE